MTPEAEALVLAHLTLVERIAKQVAKKMPAWIEMSELVAAGNLGLCEAALRFDATRHTPFHTWASIRIRGAMLDPYRGRKDPRLTESILDSWLGTSDRTDGTTEVPPQLIDPAPAIDLQLIERKNRWSAASMPGELAESSPRAKE